MQPLQLFEPINANLGVSEVAMLLPPVDKDVEMQERGTFAFCVHGSLIFVRSTYFLLIPFDLY